MSESNHPNRRDFTRLTLAAMGGLVAGLQASDQARAADEPAEEGKEKKKELHVCRGLNACKGQGAEVDLDGDGKVDPNACAGQGACATAKHITCGGQNDCKGQGGCGATPGENDCKGEGHCHVPLMDNAWKKARARFEARMKKAKKEFGMPPAKEKTPQGKKK
ncbi:MAG: hypothetical protein K1X74_06935 [Pirellulales bacterium]|nr:hypothetical protein [Pirellulales bacterium]